MSHSGVVDRAVGNHQGQQLPADRTLAQKKAEEQLVHNVKELVRLQLSAGHSFEQDGAACLMRKRCYFVHSALSI